MRRTVALSAILLLACGIAAGHAGPATPQPGGALPAAPAYCIKAHHVRRTLAERFALANTSHDGKLTLSQAHALRGMVKHFAQIDRGGKGFVTLDDIIAWRKAQREQRAAIRAAMEARNKS